VAVHRCWLSVWAVLATRQPCRTAGGFARRAPGLSSRPLWINDQTQECASRLDRKAVASCAPGCGGGALSSPNASRNVGADAGRKPFRTDVPPRNRTAGSDAGPKRTAMVGRAVLGHTSDNSFWRAGAALTHTAHPFCRDNRPELSGGGRRRILPRNVRSRVSGYHLHTLSLDH